MFKGLSMAGKLCSIEAFPVTWVIEVLACSKKLNISELIDLVRWILKLSDGVGKSARELVSLRILETLFDQVNKNKNKSVTCEKIAFDLSNSCEDVLHHILQEMSASNLKLGDLEMLKWDVQPFIACKRNGLPMIALQKLKDAILEGKHSIFTSLKERSGLVVRSQCNDNIPGDGVDPSGTMQLEERSRDTQVLSSTQYSSPNTTRNGAGELQEKHLARISLPSKRNRTDLMAENLERGSHCCQIVHATSYVPYAESAKKPKQDIHVTNHAAVEKLMVSTRDGEFSNSSERVVQHFDREGCNLENDPDIGGVEMEHTGAPHDSSNQSPDKNFKQDINSTEHITALKTTTSAGDGLSANSSARVEQHDRQKHDLEKKSERGGKDIKLVVSTHDGGYQLAALKMLTRCSDVVDAGDCNCHLQTPTNDNTYVNRAGEVQGKSTYADKANGSMEEFMEKDNSVTEAINPSSCNLRGNTSTGAEANGVVDHKRDPERASDSDGYNEERNNIELKKNALLSSQCTYSQYSFGTLPNLCIKCNSGGQLLSCSSSICPFTVHERCLGSPAEFDDDGNFYCPFCVYSRAILEYRKIKKKMSLARKNCSSFFGLNVEQSQVRRSHEMNENNKSNTDRDPSNEVDHSHLEPIVEDKLQKEPSSFRAGNFGPCGEVPADLTHGGLNTSEKENLAEEGREQECRSPVHPGEQQIEMDAHHKTDCEILSHKQEDNIHRNKREIITRRRKKVIHPSKSSLSSAPHCQASSESPEEDDPKSPASASSSRSRRPELHYTYRAVPQGRRRRRPWTKVEEDKLKEGVEKFSSSQDLTIPWTAILDFGADVFQNGRTAPDLKDKWRNMCKAASK